MIDYGIVNWVAGKKIGMFQVGCRIESDHQPLIIDLGKKYTKEEEENIRKNGKIQDWSEEGKMEFCKSIEGVEWKETGWEELEAVMKRAVRMKNRGKENRVDTMVGSRV